mgnify:CR=1 FL=1
MDASRLGIMLSMLLLVGPTSADPTPIQCIIDIHCDPMGASESVQAAQYLEWVDAVDWGLNQVEAVGAKVSFLSTGEFMEWVLDNPGPAEAVDLIPRLAASGDNFIGTHSHQRYRLGLHNWPELPPNPTDEQIALHWEDHIAAVNAVIEVQLGVTDPDAVAEINCVRGAHMPREDDEEYFQELAVLYGFPIREQGPEEAFFGHFDHFVWHPFRPSTDNLLVHNPDGPMIVSPFGPVLGQIGVHHGVFQDMSDRAVKSRFMMELLNWLDEAYYGAQPHIWSTGWSAHCHDLMPGNETYEQWSGMFLWMTDHFVDQPVSGLQAVEFSTMKASAALHVEWEKDYPDVVPFSYGEADTDMDAYPWSRAIYSYMIGLHYDTSMPEQGLVRWHRLVRDGTDEELFVLWTTTGMELVIDLSAFLDGSIEWAAIEPHRGHCRIVDLAEVPVREAGTILLPADRLEDFPWLADLDADDTVGVMDLLGVIEAWGACPDLPATCHADIDGDGVVTVMDLLAVLDGWG